MRKYSVMICLLVGLCACAAQGQATPSAPAPAAAPQHHVQLRQVAAGFDQPLLVVAHPTKPTLLVVEQPGTIRTLSGTLFLDIRDRVRASGSEQGLLGLAFDPGFAHNQRLYVNYTGADGATFISRFSATDAADPASEEVLLTVEQPAANHNGGMLAFGPDGYLYIGLGDGGGANDTYGNAQRRDTLLGKLLRIDVSPASGYAIPPTNPWPNTPTVRPEIWAYGLRNPWRFSFDRQTGNLYIGDVGQNRFEWLLYQPAGTPGGRNYGWPITEGAHCLQGDSCDRSGLIPPLLEYPHSEGCSIVGGFVYRGTAHADWFGTYLFSDYCSATIWQLLPGPPVTKAAVAQAPGRVSSFGQDATGELFVTIHDQGTVYQLSGAE